MAGPTSSSTGFPYSRLRKLQSRHPHRKAVQEISRTSPPFPPLGSLSFEDVFSRCCTIYEAEKVRVLSPYPHIPGTPGELRRRGFPMAVLTDAHNGNALARLQKTDLFQYFDHVISFDMTGAKKPAPDAFLLALKKLGSLPSETLLIGDILQRDIGPAQALGMITAYAAYEDRNVRRGNPPKCKPDYVLGDIRELVGLVDSPISSVQ